MKTKTLITIVLIAGAARTFGALIDVTPGGINWNTATKIPPALLTIFRLENRGALAFFDEARVIPYTGSTPDFRGWVSRFGVLDGGTLFDTDLMALDPAPAATLTWDFLGSGYSARWIDVFGHDANGVPWEHIFYANGKAFENQGSALLTLNGNARVEAIAFWGRTPSMVVPDSGATLSLFALALLLLSTFVNRERV